MANTGKVMFQNLEEYDEATGIATGNTKPNVIGDPDYVPPKDASLVAGIDCPLSEPEPEPTTVVVSIDTNPETETSYNNQIVNGWEAGRIYPINITPALEPGETLTLNYTFLVSLMRSQEVDCGATARVKLNDDQLFRSFNPGELSVFPGEEATGSVSITPGTTNRVTFDHTAFAITGQTSSATASVTITGASISGSNRPVTINNSSSSFTLPSGGTEST